MTGKSPKVNVFGSWPNRAAVANNVTSIALVRLEFAIFAYTDFTPTGLNRYLKPKNDIVENNTMSAELKGYSRRFVSAAGR